MVRWDILNCGEPENLGLISPDGKLSQYICQMVFDDSGVLHMADVCGEHSPYILAVDVKKLTPPGDDAQLDIIKPYNPPLFHMSDDKEYFMQKKQGQHAPYRCIGQ